MANNIVTLYDDDQTGIWGTCPHCGHHFQLPMESIDHHLLHQVSKLARHSGAASTKSLALAVHLSVSQTTRRLNRLADLGLVRRVGERGGWQKSA